MTFNYGFTDFTIHVQYTQTDHVPSSGRKVVLRHSKQLYLCHKLCDPAGDIRSFSYNSKIDLSPMVWEQNWISKILNVECTLNWKIGDLQHPFPVKDEMKNNVN